MKIEDLRAKIWKIEETYPLRYVDEIFRICSPKIQFAVELLLSYRPQNDDVNNNVFRNLIHSTFNILFQKLMSILYEINLSL
jgi:hypothetical protein